MEDEKIIAAAQAAFNEAAKPEHGLWFSSLAWEDVENLHPVFIACAKAVVTTMKI